MFNHRYAVRGVTLLEVLIVLVLLGIIVTIVVPILADKPDTSSQTVFAANLRTFANAATLYYFDHGDYLEDSSSGSLPRGFGFYITPEDWLGETPIGGVWDSEKDSFGYRSAVGVHFHGGGERKDDAFMAEIDAKCDDGNLSTGRFRKIAGDRYYMIIAH